MNGDKGVISAIVPDDQMPRDSQGRPFEILLAPDGLNSRTNFSQKLESAMGKIAEKTGQPVVAPDFSDIPDLNAWAEGQLKAHGLTATEDIHYPDRNVRVPSIMTGNRFYMKLHHTSESKGQGRGGGGYSGDELPAKGGDTGCFVGDAPVRTFELDRLGETPIGRIVQTRARIPLASFNPGRGSTVGQVSDWFEYRADPAKLRTVELEDGRTFSLTHDHRLLLADGRLLPLSALQPGDDLQEL